MKRGIDTYVMKKVLATYLDGTRCVQSSLSTPRFLSHLRYYDSLSYL